MDIKIHVKRQAYKFLDYWVQNDDKEIAGYCEASYDKDKKVIIVSKAHIVKMLSNSGSSVKLDNQDHHRLITELPDEAELRCHWHSHVNMGVNPSSTDDATNIENADHGWFCSLILNKDRKISGQIAFPTKSEFGERVVYYKDIPVSIEGELSGDELDFAHEELKRVQPPKPVETPSVSNYYRSNEYYDDKEWDYINKMWVPKKGNVTPIGIGHKSQTSLFDNDRTTSLLNQIRNSNQISEADLNDVPGIEDWGWLGLGLEVEAKMLCMSPRKYRNIITNQHHKKFQTTIERLEAIYDQQLGNK